jgi:hypothetical protein
MSRGDDSQWARSTAPRDQLPGRNDVLEHAGRRVPPVALLLALAGLVVGLIVGYSVGEQDSGSPQAGLSPSASSASPAPVPSTPVPEFGQAVVTQSGRQCSEQTGPRKLQLGVQVTNTSRSLVVLRTVRALLPLGGLTETAHAWGTCGQLPNPGNSAPNALPAGASAWFTVTFRVGAKCPGALPVQFRLSFWQPGRVQNVRLPGFVDLGHVPYSGCPVG